MLWTEKSATYNNLAGNHVWEWCGRLGVWAKVRSGQNCVLGKNPGFPNKYIDLFYSPTDARLRYSVSQPTLNADTERKT